jgi:hypothetical protein
VANLAWEQGYRWEMEITTANSRNRPSATWSLGIDGGEFGTGMGQVSLDVIRVEYNVAILLRVVGGKKTRVNMEECYTKRLNFTNAPRTKFFPPPRRLPQIQIYSDGERIVVRTCQTLDPASQV